MSTESRDWLTTKQVTRILGVSHEGLRRLLTLGAIEASRMPLRTPGVLGRAPGTTNIRYDRQSVDDFKARRMTQTEFLAECRSRGFHVTPYYVRLWMKSGALVHGRDFIGRVSHRWFFPPAVEVAHSKNPQPVFPFSLEHPKSIPQSPVPVQS